MSVRTLADLEKMGRIKFPADQSFRSARFLIASDGLGFSYNENRVAKGTTLEVWLKNHWEANYIVSGQVVVTDLDSGTERSLHAGMLYVVGPNDRHRLQFKEDECHISVFFPPLTGNERFDADGSYEASGPIEQTDRRMFIRTLEGRRATEGGASPRPLAHLRQTALLSEPDDVGFTLDHMHLEAGRETILRCGKTPQALHILSGDGELWHHKTGARWRVSHSMCATLPSETSYGLRALSEFELLNIGSVSAAL